jgi:uncharacterized protein YecT (DUF1311 family)
MEKEEHPTERGTGERRQMSRWLIVALVAAVLAGVLLASTVWDNRWKSDDNAVGNSIAETKPADMEKWCAAQATYDAMKRELFRRAAQVRGSDDQAYARLSDFALLRVNGPVARGIDDQLSSVTCSGAAVLSLPPAVQVAGGRRSLSGDIDYIVQPAADGTGNVVRLGNADAIVVPLATLTRTAAPQPAPAPAPTADFGNEATGTPPADQQQAPPQAAPEPPRQTASPSFNCANARTRGEIAVCNSSSLAALDRQMAGQYNAAVSEADSSQRRLLERTRNRFLSYRDRCGSDECIANTYRSRMREISDIMADRWRG